MTQPIGTPALEDLEQAIGALSSLRRMAPLERARYIGELDTHLRAVLGRVADEAVFQAVHVDLVGVRRRSHSEVAGALGVSPSRVNQRITAYRQWVDAREAVTP